MISFIVPTMGRPSLLMTLKSIRTLPGDEIIVIGNVSQVEVNHIRYIPCDPGKDGGNHERNVAMKLARGTHLAFIDDDDVCMPDARLAMEDAMLTTPYAPVLFKMRYPNGYTLWRDQQVRVGNFGTPCIFVPNKPDMLGVWWEGRNCGDFGFVSSFKWKQEDIVWRPEVVALLGCNPGQSPTDAAKMRAAR